MYGSGVESNTKIILVTLFTLIFNSHIIHIKIIPDTIQNVGKIKAGYANAAFPAFSAETNKTTLIMVYVIKNNNNAFVSLVILIFQPPFLLLPSMLFRFVRFVHHEVFNPNRLSQMMFFLQK